MTNFLSSRCNLSNLKTRLPNFAISREHNIELLAYPHNKRKFYKQEDVLWAILPSWARSIMRIYPIKKLKSFCLGDFEHGKEHVFSCLSFLHEHCVPIFVYCAVRGKGLDLFSNLFLSCFSDFALKIPSFLITSSFSRPLDLARAVIPDQDWVRNCPIRWRVISHVVFVPSPVDLFTLSRILAD